SRCSRNRLLRVQYCLPVSCAFIMSRLGRGLVPASVGIYGRLNHDFGALVLGTERLDEDLMRFQHGCHSFVMTTQSRQITAMTVQEHAQIPVAVGQRLTTSIYGFVCKRF